METIAKNEYYEIYFNAKNNRVYYSPKGYWEKVEDVPNYLNDIRKVLKYVKPNFTMLVDTSKLQPHPQDITELRMEAQKMAVEEGMLIAAQVVSQDFISNFQFDDMTDGANFRKGKFLFHEDAEKWLDEQTSKLLANCH